jgi:hypothetical protein
VVLAQAIADAFTGTRNLRAIEGRQLNHNCADLCEGKLSRNTCITTSSYHCQTWANSNCGSGICRNRRLQEEAQRTDPTFFVLDDYFNDDDDPTLPSDRKLTDRKLSLPSGCDTITVDECNAEKGILLDAVFKGLTVGGVGSQCSNLVLSPFAVHCILLMNGP